LEPLNNKEFLGSCYQLEVESEAMS